MKHPYRIITTIGLGWATYLVVCLLAWSDYSSKPYRYRQVFDWRREFTHDANQQGVTEMKLMQFIKNFVMVAAVLMGAVNMAEAQSAVTPTISPMKLGIDYRRNATPNLEQPGTYVNQYVVSGSAVVSAVSPMSQVSGTSYVAYRISPAIDTSSGALCNYLVRNNAVSVPVSGTSVTDGTAWEQNRTSGWLNPGATAATERWVGI